MTAVLDWPDDAIPRWRTAPQVPFALGYCVRMRPMADPDEAGALDDLAWLQGWYAEQCDSDWEHDESVSIGTLDNPGWRLR
jgi:hypothetical protein